MARTRELIEISLKMRNRFLRRVRGSCTKEPRTLQFIFHLFRNVCLFYLVSVLRKRIGYRPFQLPALDEMLYWQWTELEFGSYHYPVNSSNPSSQGLGLRSSFQIHRIKKHLIISNKGALNKHYISSHIECTFILRSFIRDLWPNAFFPNYIQP